MFIVLSTGCIVQAVWLARCNLSTPGAHHTPISKPFVAGIESMAWPSIASSLSKQGSPHPGGTPRITHETVPATEGGRPLRPCSRTIACPARRNEYTYLLLNPPGRALLTPTAAEEAGPFRRRSITDQRKIIYIPDPANELLHANEP